MPCYSFLQSYYYTIERESGEPPIEKSAKQLPYEYILSSSCSPDVTLDLFTVDLLELLDIDVPPDQDTNEQQRDERRAGNDHLPLDIGIRADNRIPDRTAHRVRLLHDNRAVNLRGEILGVFRQAVVQLDREHVGPQGAGNGEADGDTNGAEHAEDGRRDGDLLVADGGLDCELAGRDPNAAGDAVEHLAHDEVPDGGAWRSEVDEQRGAEQAEGDSGVRDQLVAASHAD